MPILSPERSRNRYILLGVSFFLICLFFTKYNFAVLTAMAIFLEEMVSFFISGKRLVIDRALFIFAPTVTVITLWLLSFQNGISSFFWVLSNPTTYSAGLTDFWGYLLFYQEP